MNRKLQRLLTVLVGVLLAISVLSPAALAKDPKAPATEWLPAATAPSPESIPGAQVLDQIHMTRPAKGGTSAPLPQAESDSLEALPAMPICPPEPYGFSEPSYYDSYEEEVFYEYRDTNTYIDWENRLRGVIRLDNRFNVNPVTLAYKQQESGTHTMSVSYSKDVTASIKLWLVNVSGKYGYSTTETYSWTSSSAIEITMTVPAGKVGYIYSYNAAMITEGDAWYRVYERWYDDVTCRWVRTYIGTRSYPISAAVPTQGYYSYKTVVADY